MANISKNKKYHYLYKTTNLVSGKYYFGMHSTNNLEDGYLGSGKYIGYAIKKYGKEGFRIDILEFFETREALAEAEQKLVTKAQIGDPDCMNLKPGGVGGFTEEYAGRDKFEGHRKKLQEDEEYRERYSLAVSRGSAKRIQGGYIGYWKGRVGTFSGKKHNLETIEKMRASHRGVGAGERNSQFGTKWITNEIENKKIKTTDQIPEGWRAGRKIK